VLLQKDWHVELLEHWRLNWDTNPDGKAVDLT